MLKLIFFLVSNVIAAFCFSQPMSSSSIFAHNDYLKPNPFYNAYSLEVGYIEADVFLKNGELLVAHTRMGLNNSRTLDSLYLKPLHAAIIKNKGLPYPSGKNLTLMIDLKSDGKLTLDALVDKMKNYPELIDGKNFTIAVSGNMPDPSTWKNYPDFIHFDGRPKMTYTAEQLTRVVMISDNFRNYSRWDGNGVLTKDEAEKLLIVIKRSHDLGKPVRFWAIPDNATGWAKLNAMLVDIINTDNVAEAIAFMKER